MFNGEILKKNYSENVEGARKQDIMRTVWIGKVFFILTVQHLQ